MPPASLSRQKASSASRTSLWTVFTVDSHSTPYANEDGVLILKEDVSRRMVSLGLWPERERAAKASSQAIQ